MIGVSWAVFVVTGLIKEKGDLSKFIQPLSHTEFLIPVIILSVFFRYGFSVYGTGIVVKMGEPNGSVSLCLTRRGRR